MRLPITLATLLLVSGLSTFARDNQFAGTWKLNAAKSTGPAPACAQNGILKLPSEIYTGGAIPASARVPHSAKCTGVYQFTASPDGRTLTLTRPQVDANYKAVFDKQ